MPEVALPGQMEAMARVREWLAAWRESEDLIQLGAYVRGTNAVADQAIDRMPEILRFLRQASGEGTALEQTLEWLLGLATAEVEPRLVAADRRRARRPRFNS